MKKVITILFIIIITLSMTGCPAGKPTNEEIVNGRWFRQEINAKLWRDYDINISTSDLPEITLIYYTYKDNSNYIKFTLDGFDPQKKIGYKFATNKDKETWDNLRSKGNTEAPNLNDIAVIQNEALKYQYPVLFIWEPYYWESMEDIWLYQEIDDMFNTDIMKQWQKDIQRKITDKDNDFFIVNGHKMNRHEFGNYVKGATAQYAFNGLFTSSAVNFLGTMKSCYDAAIKDKGIDMGNEIDDSNFVNLGALDMAMGIIK